MHRRIFHPFSLSVIRQLSRVTKDELEVVFVKYSDCLPSSKRSDVLLGSLLLGMRDEGQIKSLIMDQCQDLKFRSHLPHLLAAFEDVVGKKEADMFEAKEGLGVYSRATCYEFHQLLVATLSAYANTLGRFCDAQRELNVHMNGEAGMGEGWRDVGAGIQRKASGSGVQRAGAKKKKVKTTGVWQGIPKGARKPEAKADYVAPKPDLADPQEKVTNIWKLAERRNRYAQLLWECTFLLW